MLMLCLTGLPLIFHHEIDDFFGDEVPAASVPAGSPKADLDTVVANGMAQAPGEFLHFLIWDHDDPNVVFLSVAKQFDAPSVNNRFIRVDAHTGEYLDSPLHLHHVEAAH